MDALDSDKSEENLAVEGDNTDREFDYIEKACMEVEKGNSRGKVVVKMTD